MCGMMLATCFQMDQAKNPWHSTFASFDKGKIISQLRQWIKGKAKY